MTVLLGVATGSPASLPAFKRLWLTFLLGVATGLHCLLVGYYPVVDRSFGGGYRTQATMKARRSLWLTVLLGVATGNGWPNASSAILWLTFLFGVATGAYGIRGIGSRPVADLSFWGGYRSRRGYHASMTVLLGVATG